MKKFVFVLSLITVLSAVMLLSGCGNDETEQQTTVQPVTEPTLPVVVTVPEEPTTVPEETEPTTTAGNTKKTTATTKKKAKKTVATLSETEERYDDNGRLIYEPRFDSETDDYTGYHTFEYNSEGKLYKEFSYTSEGVLTEYFVSEYNATGQESRRSAYSTDNTLTGYMTYIYDEDGELISVENYDALGNLIEN